MSSDGVTVVLVTGANQGIGFESVKKLAAEQANYHIFLASRNAQRGQEAAQKITNLAKSTSVEALSLDIDNDDSIAAAARTVEQKFGRLDVLVNNAAISHVAGASFRDNMIGVLHTNAVGPTMVTEAFLPLLKKAAAPRVVFVSMGLASITKTLDPTWEFFAVDNKAYQSSKAAMNMVAALYAAHLDKEGFKVNMVCPGWRSTNLNHYSEGAGDPAGGATEICKLVVNTAKHGPNGRFFREGGEYPW